MEKKLTCRPSLARPISPLVPSLAPVGSRRWPPPPPARPRTCAPAWPPPRAGKAGDKPPEASPIHSPHRLSPSSRISSSSLLPPLEPSSSSSRSTSSHGIPPPSSLLAPPRRPGHLCRRQSFPKLCIAPNAVVFQLRPPDLSRRFASSRRFPSRPTLSRAS